MALFPSRDYIPPQQSNQADIEERLAQIEERLQHIEQLLENIETFMGDLMEEPSDGTEAVPQSPAEHANMLDAFRLDAFREAMISRVDREEPPETAQYIPDATMVPAPLEHETWHGIEQPVTPRTTRRIQPRENENNDT